MFGKKIKEYDLTQDELDRLQYAIIKTGKGDIKIKLFPDKAPNTVANFAHLADSGFYRGLKFHRVIPGFMAQGGCPNTREGAGGVPGTGGPDWNIRCETSNGIAHKRGVISMAHAGRDTGGSQFFITFVDTPHLDGVHTVFGEIEEGDADSFAVLDSIEADDDIIDIVIEERSDS